MKLITDRASVLIAFKAQFPFPFKELTEVLANENFSVPPEGETILGVDKDGKRRVFGKLISGDVELLYQEDEGRLTINSDDFTDVLDVVENVMSKVDSIPDALTEIKWYELNHRSRVLEKYHPMDISWRKNKTGSETLEKITGLKTQPFRTVICASGLQMPDIPLNTVPDWLHFTIGPFVPNPRYFTVGIVYRRQNLEEIISLGRQIRSLIESMINEL